AGLAFVHLHVNSTLECRTDLFDVVHNDSLGTHGCGHFCVGLALNVTSNKTTVIELNLILLFGTPLTVVEYHSSHRNVVTDSGHNFDHAHSPSTVTCISNSRTIRGGGFSTDDRWQRVSAVTKAHGGKEAAGALKTQVTVSHCVDIPNISGNHDILWHGVF